MQLNQGDDVRDNWKAHNALANAHGVLNRAQSRTRDMATNIPRVQWDHTLGMFPFKIYVALPSQLPAGYDLSTAWRSVMVRSGQVNQVNLSGLVSSAGAAVSVGCDGHVNDPFDDNLPSETDSGHQVSPIAVPDLTDAYYFWIEMADGTPKLWSGTDPTTVMTPAKTPWTSFPDADGIHILIGVVKTSVTDLQAVITQYLSGHLNNYLSLSGCDETGASLNILIPNALIDTSEDT